MTVERSGRKHLERLWETSKAAAAAIWTRPSRRWVAVFLLSFAAILIYTNIHHVPLPRVRIEYNGDPSLHPSTTTPTNITEDSSFKPKDLPYNASKVALLVESRSLPNLAPLILHFISVVPPDWRFRFMGSESSVSSLNRSHAIRSQVNAGKLDLTYIPSNMSTDGQEMISRFLTSLWLYEVVLQPAEWLLIFQTDSILCANSKQNLNDFLEYDWVGAPWNPNGRFGGNGGLSLRRVSAIIEVLQNQIRADNSEPEDVWLTERLGHRPNARMANGTLSLTFSGEINTGELVQAPSIPSRSQATPAPSDYYMPGIDDWRQGFYEPMGYHTGSSGQMLHAGIWGDEKRRQHIWKYCPEVKMTLAMDVAKFVPGNCNANWKRDDLGRVVCGFGKESTEGDAYPLLPPELVPW
ncbi:hypothetical protein F5Y18DRAFT_423880 [Xylariaceae sp. FL1019]|nr:hypothetical protein F5Y18DRAFT_423880 [Xylariaceae sp. FL1019]